MPRCVMPHPVTPRAVSRRLAALACLFALAGCTITQPSPRGPDGTGLFNGYYTDGARANTLPNVDVDPDDILDFRDD